MSRWRTTAGPWFGVAVVLAIAAVLLSDPARDAAMAAAFIVFVGACIRATALAVRDDDVSSATIRGPGGRVLGMMGADSPAARKRRRLERERRAKEQDPR